MKVRKMLGKLAKVNAVIVSLGLILSLIPFTPTVAAKTKYKTLAYDKRLETRQDFEKGEFKNIKLKGTDRGIEMSSLNDEKAEYVTPIIEAPFGATHIGIHWKENLPKEDSIVTYLRTSKDGESFGDWEKATVEAEEGRDDKKAEETFTALVATDKTNFAQAKVEFTPKKGVSPKLKNLTLTFLNSAEESAQTVKKLSFLPGDTSASEGIVKTSPNGQSVSVISREDWGADENYRLKIDGTEEWPRAYHGTRKLIVHHTAVVGSNGDVDLESNKATVRSIYYYHAITQGWGDIGYNALVDAAGNVYEGRYGTHSTAPTRTAPTADDIMALDVEAGHASSYNGGSFGVSAMGDFTSFDVPAAQLTGMENVLAYVADSRGINVQGSSDFLRYDGTWHNNLNNLIAHRDVSATACPGDLLYAQMTNIKNSVDNRPGMLTNLSGFSATMNSNPVSGTNVGVGTIDFSWSAFTGATQYQYLLERIYGTPGLPGGEPWENAWLIPENTNMQTTTNTSVQVDSATLQTNSNYVFYVRALDINGTPISTATHVNFKRDNSVPDLSAPVATITNPADGATVSGTVTITAVATDDVGVTLFELYIDGVKKTSTTTGNLSYSWNTKKVANGTHTIMAKAYDASGKTGTATISVIKGTVSRTSR